MTNWTTFVLMRSLCCGIVIALAYSITCQLRRLLQSRFGCLFVRSRHDPHLERRHFTTEVVSHAMKGPDRGLLTGAVIGKALGNLDSGTGVIEVLVTLQ